MGGVEVPQSPRGWSVGMGYPPSPVGEGSERGLCPSPPKKKKIVFLLKIPCFDAF